MLMQIGLLTLTQLSLWGLGTLFLALISLRALRNPRCHGFYRFFAFSTSAAVVIPNLPYWYVNLFAPHQVASWLLLFPSLGLLLGGLYLLITRGGQRDKAIPRENFAFENTSALIETGIFHYIRHPMYSALILFTWGACLKHATWLGLGLCLVTTAILWLAATIEEWENLQYFGDAYQQYSKRSKAFIPFVL
ncbi:MAG: methyltransferase [Cellvibrionaceae bacterium]